MPIIPRFVAGLRAFFEELPAGAFPHLRAHAGAMTSGAPRERFEFGLDMLIERLDRYSG